MTDDKTDFFIKTTIGQYVFEVLTSYAKDPSSNNVQDAYMFAIVEILHECQLNWFDSEAQRDAILALRDEVVNDSLERLVFEEASTIAAAHKPKPKPQHSQQFFRTRVLALIWGMATGVLMGMVIGVALVRGHL